MSASARPAVAGSPSPRVLLIHANPFQRVAPVPAYGLERLRTAIEPLGAEVELLDPFLFSEDPLGSARAAAERFRPDLIGLGVRIIDDCIVVDRLEAPDEEPTDVSFLLPEILELRRALGEVAPEATFLVGGAGFSACPQECLEYLDVEFGVVGAGEEALAAICEGETVDGARQRGVGRVSIFFADDEFNLPDERHPIAVLTGIAERGLASHLTWRGYFNPTPFSPEFAELVRETNGHVSITVDSAADNLLETAQKPFRRRHLDALIALIGEHGVSADLGLIFGLPGETEDTIAETVDFVRDLPESIEVVYSSGARVYPHTPLSRIAVEEPERLVGPPDPSFLTPVVYSRPWPPRELARRLEETFAGLPNVNRVGVAYRSGQTTLADAYRAVLEPTLQQTVAKSNGKGRWAEILGRAARDEDPSRKPAESVAACMQVALWHGRYDLASAAAARLLREETPPEMSRAQLRFARFAYGGLALADRAKAALRR